MRLKMKPIRALAALVACTATLGHAQDSGCQSALNPVHRSMPDYPSPEQAERYLRGTSYMHVFVEGRVAVEFTVARDGSVSDARIVESTYQPIGRRASSYKAGYFDGFLEINVLPAVKAWRFSPLAQPCRSRVTFTWQFEEGA
jgi:outer membrane biosynthesis protein TonB